MQNGRPADRDIIQDNIDPLFLFTVDVEDWFQVENFKPWIPFNSWPEKELRVERNIHNLLNLLDGGEEKRKATFFILGWLAQRYPHLVKEIHARGHEIASHGFNHHLPTSQTKEDLRDDLIQSRKLLEDQIGQRVCGYRAPSFAVNDEILKIIHECGYIYDSSYNSFDRHGRYGRVDMSRYSRKGIAIALADDFFELPISNLHLKGQVIPWGGGGYFRMIPVWMYTKLMKYTMHQEGAFVFYTHPWEIDPGQPYVSQASIGFKFRHYLHINRTGDKFSYMFGKNCNSLFVTCSEYLARLVSGYCI